MDKELMILPCLGGICGLIVALLLHRCRNAVVLTIGLSLVTGTAAQIIAGFIWGVHDAHTPDHWLQAGIAGAFLLAFAAPFTGGLPAVLVGFVCQRFIQKCCRK